MRQSSIPPSRLRAAVCSAIVVGSLAAVSPVAAESYETRSGDTFTSIASRYGVSVSRLQSANPSARPERLMPGQILTIPSRSSSSTSTRSVAGTTSGTHRVAAGETLSEIARRYGMSSSALAAANGISNPRSLQLGQVLQLGGTARSSTPAAGTGNTGGAGTYTVRSGDVLSSVASRLGTTSRDLARANGLSNADRLQVGQVLRVPSAGASTATPVVTTGTTSAVSGRYRNLPSRLLANPSRLVHVPSFERWAAHYGIPVNFLMAVSWLESGWQNTVVSHKDAVGIGQLMPKTSRWLADEIIGVPSLDPRVPDDNIRMTAAFLSWLRREMGSTEMALAAYYQGPSSVRMLGVFPVTEVYVAAVTSLFGRFR